MKNQDIIFAFYKNNQLIGYRLDTIGSIGMKSPKIYSYSKEQVDIVLKNIESNLKSSDGFGKALGIEELINTENKVHQLLQDQKVFEVRVLKAPQRMFETEFNVATAKYETSLFPTYPSEQVKQWLQYPEQHEVIETHYFSMIGKMNLQ